MLSLAPILLASACLASTDKPSDIAEFSVGSRCFIGGFASVQSADFPPIVDGSDSFPQLVATQLSSRLGGQARFPDEVGFAAASTFIDFRWDVDPTGFFVSDEYPSVLARLQSRTSLTINESYGGASAPEGARFFAVCDAPFSRNRCGIRIARPTKYLMDLDAYLETTDAIRFAEGSASTATVSASLEIDRVRLGSVQLDASDLLERANSGGNTDNETIVIATGWVQPDGRDYLSMSPNLRADIDARDNPETMNARDFLSANMRFIILASRPGCALADWDGSDSIDVADFSAYLNDWSAAEPDADLTSAGTCDITNIDGIVDMSDFACFLSQWSEGCP